MVGFANFELKYPCYFALGPEGGLQLNNVNGIQCLCVFTSELAVVKFYEAIHRHLHGPAKGRLRAKLDKCPDSKALLDRLTLLIDDMAKDGIRHIAIDPLPGNPVAYTTILELISELRGK